MNSSKINCRLSVLAVLLTAASLAGYSVAGDHPKGSTGAPLHPSGATSVLQADGVGPVPLPPPPKLQSSTASSQS
jgi:hypothetical protein